MAVGQKKEILELMNKCCMLSFYITYFTVKLFLIFIFEKIVQNAYTIESNVINLLIVLIMLKFVYSDMDLR